MSDTKTLFKQKNTRQVSLVGGTIPTKVLTAQICVKCEPF